MENTTMKSLNSVLSLGIAAAFAAVLGATPALTRAAQTDLAQAPLATSASATVLPNLMFILDNSTSMETDRMPDEVKDDTTCKKCLSGSCDIVGTKCDRGHPPYYAAPFNTIYYNPQTTYSPAVNSTGASLGNSDPTAALSEPFLGGTSKKNLTTTYREIYWCKKTNPSSDELTDPSLNVCRQNGITMPGSTFTYDNTSNDDGSGGYPTKTYLNAVIKDTHNPFYYEITPREFCTDQTLAQCSFTKGGTFLLDAPVRFCKSAAKAADTNVVSGPAVPDCQSKVSSSYKYPRFGKFTRTDIVSSGTFGNRPNRTDCAAKPNCSYTEELQNFANWYTYYRIRASLMKTVTGQAFLGLDDRFRVGFVTINIESPASDFYLKIDKFDATHRAAWYNTFYKSPHVSGTPLKEALSRVGRHYAAVTTGINSLLPDDPVQFSCQQNFALLTTDGYYNSDPGQQIDGSSIGNQDNDDAGFSKRDDGAYDGNLPGSKDSLADVAMYYYKTDLRPTGAVSKDNVPNTDKDKASHQHMVTFTLGLGLDGLMTYRPDYETAGTGDFEKIKKGDPAPACSWTTKKCDWPEPKSSQPTALDDLWHAAVNGRGLYFSAKEPKSLQSGLATALASIQITTGAAAASATSTPNITPTDNFIYSSTYRTVKWDGEVVAEQIDVGGGGVAAGVVWTAGAQLDSRVSINSDTRTIYTFTTVFADNRKSFTYANMSVPQKAHFDNKCASLPQCPSLSPGQQAAVNSGDNLIKWLRGQSKKEDGVIFREREHVLGDVVNAKPAFVGEPNLLFGEATYGSFKTANATRQSVLYIAANDGMLHALNGATTPNAESPSAPAAAGGSELWAWVPRMLWPELYKLASTTYDKSHRFYVDGSPVSMDVFIGGAWKTILVGGLNAGGRGYYAIDITNPNSPKGLWEVCADPTGVLQCTDKDDNIGFTYGQPIITKRPTDGKWVVIVSSGYNNVSPGDGKGYLFVIDAETGKILDKTDTGVGDTTTPSGFARITGFAVNFAVNNATTFVYGGDLLGNMWRFDMSTSGPTRQLISQARDGSGKMQSITTRPEVTCFDPPLCLKRVVYVGTGRLLDGTDIPDPATLTPPVLDLAYQQTVYGFKDTGANLGDLRDPAANLVPQTLFVADPTSRTISNNPVDWDTQNGWFVDLNPSIPPAPPGTPPGDSPGERVNIDPQLVKGVLIVQTNEPNSDACSTGGDSFLYQFDYQTGSYVESAQNNVVGVKLASALAAGFVVYRLPTGQLKYTSIDVTGKKATGGVNPGSGGASGSRASWRELY
jgi:type IV pilus assembly protein PilY1